MKTPKIDHINMRVPNMEEAIEWYTKYLGFVLKGRFKRDENYEIVYLDNGTVVYELIENREITNSVVDHIAYISDDITADYDYYVALGLNPTPITYVDFLWDNGADYFFIDGPANEKIELIHIR